MKETDKKNKTINVKVLEWHDINEADKWELVWVKRELDQWIANLVIGLNKLGFPTICSCQGHYEDDGKHSYSCVTIDPYVYETTDPCEISEDTYFLEALVEEWNKIQRKQEKKIFWEISHSGCPEIIPVQRNAPLPELHKSADEFGRWLQRLSREEIKKIRTHAELKWEERIKALDVEFEVIRDPKEEKRISKC